MAGVNVWDELARRCLMGRQYTKRVVMKAAFGGYEDPWLEHIVMGELLRFEREQDEAAAGPWYAGERAKWLRQEGLAKAPGDDISEIEVMENLVRAKEAAKRPWGL